jgi:hypothetical protein
VSLRHSVENFALRKKLVLRKSLHLCTVVEDVLAIAGGDDGQWSLVMPGGRVCADHDMPALPQTVTGFALAQAYDKLVFMCGGTTTATTMNCEYLKQKKNIFRF